MHKQKAINATTFQNPFEKCFRKTVRQIHRKNPFQKQPIWKFYNQLISFGKLISKNKVPLHTILPTPTITCVTSTHLLQQ